jgi:choline dehydrogenase-like flavoprotein
MGSTAEPPFDVIVVGSGAAGVSCAWRLVATGRRVAMVDGGRVPAIIPPDMPYLEYRRTEQNQGALLFGPDYGATPRARDESPKLRAPSLRYVFEGFAEAYALRTTGFQHCGSLAVGGMTNAWGGGVSCFTDADVAGWPIGRSDLVESYRAVVKRIGVSGRSDDDLRDFFAWDDDLQPPLPLVEPAANLLAAYGRQKGRRHGSHFMLGHARNAVISEDHGDGRKACDRLGWCLWGCARRSIYSARYEVETLARQPGFTHLPGRFVEEVATNADGWTVRGRGPSAGDRFDVSARHVALACGPIGTATLVLRALQLTGTEVRFCSCPPAAFAVIQPGLVGGAIPERVFAAAQLSIVLPVDGAPGPIFGNIFSPAGLPVSELIARSPLPARSSMTFFRWAMPGLLVGNVFMPSELSDHRLMLRADGGVDVTWRYAPALDDRLTRAIRRALTSAMRSCGAWLMPGGFKPDSPGSDMHYAGTVPMRADPAGHQATHEGEVRGLPGVFVVDGSALPSLPAKAHTLTIMANADRIAGIIDRRLKR